MPNLILYTALILTIYLARTTNAQDPDSINCAAVLCLAVFPEDCEDDETFVPGNIEEGRCCNACVKNCVKPQKVDCRLVRCVNVEPSDCQEDEGYVRNNSCQGICCNQCAKIDEIIPCKPYYP